MSRTVQLPAIIDEKTNFDVLFGQGTIKLEGSLVRRVNSAGIRTWVRKIEAMRVAKVRFSLVAASPIVVRYINEISGFFDKQEIESFQLPFLCANCGKEHVRTVTQKDAAIFGTRPAPIDCDCGSKAEFDETEDYFGFLQR